MISQYEVLLRDFRKLQDVSPRVVYYPQYDSEGECRGVCVDGIRALSYDGVDYQGTHTKIFAHIGFPENIDKPVPAVVLVHGGGGHPEDVWIRKWNQRGFAAIAMDTTGYFPTKPVPYLCEGVRKGWNAACAILLLRMAIPWVRTIPTWRI